MKAKKMLSCILVMVLLASVVPMAITPAAALYEKKLPGDADENNELTKGELVKAILPYMLGEGGLKLDDVGDAAYVYAYWEGEPKTITDMAERVVTFYRPVERVVTGKPDPLRLAIVLGECDKIVGVAYYDKYCLCREESVLCRAAICGGKLFELPEVGTWYVTNLELAASLKPDVIFGAGSSGAEDVMQEKTGISAVYLKSGGHKFEDMYEAIELMGTIFRKENEAEEFVSFVEETIGNIEEVTSQIPEEEKPEVYFATRGYSSSGGYGWGFASTTGRYDPLDIAGGINVAKGISGGKVSKEQIIAWNPDIIIIAHSFGSTLEEMNDVERVLLDPDLQLINAVKNESVYFTIYPYCLGTPQDKNLVATMYLAKLLHPDKFKDLDVEEEGNKIMKRFLGVDGLFSEYADYTVWMREWLESQE